jgi:hypothetical protein
MAVNGIALGCVAGGALFLYAGITGKDIPEAIRATITGQGPGAAQVKYPITAPAGGGSGSGSGGGAGPPGSATAGGYTHNLIEVGKYMHANGYSRAAAAGIAGCVAGESGGNPESAGDGGNGLIGWTPPKPGIITGNATADLNTQLPMIISYNNEQVNAQELIAQLNAISNPVSAADFYSQAFERPKVTDSDVRPAVALLVYGVL